MTFTNDTTTKTVSSLPTGTVLPRVEHLEDRGDGAYSASVACIDPNGVTRVLTIEFTYFDGLPEIDLEHVTLDGDADAGMALAARNVDALRRVLTRAVHDARASAA